MSITAAKAQRMIPKQKGLEISTGTLSNKNWDTHYYLQIGVTINARNGNYQLWALEYTHRDAPYKELRIPLQTYTAEAGYSLQLLSVARRSIALNAALTGVMGYETINEGKDMLYDGAKIISEENFIYGLGGRLSLETYLSDHWVLLIQGRTKLLWGTSLVQLRPSAGVGLRFNF